jgi:hypothetical protein
MACTAANSDSMMSFEQPFSALGQRVRSEWRRHDFDESALPAIAAGAARDFDTDFEFAVEQIAEFLERTAIRQQVSNNFSNLPITVYRDQDFYIELLIWTQATTEIHEHAFCGSFKVLQGKSLHTRHRFSVDDRISLNFLCGRLETIDSEQLAAGDVREIHPGGQGLVHSLYHLETPSVTMVIRTPGLPAYQPQYTYLPPRFCINSHFLAHDDLAQMLRRLLATAAQVDPETAQSRWLERVVELDFPRLAWLLIQHHDSLAEDESKARAMQSVVRAHGERATALFEVLEERKRVKALVNARAVISDPKSRRFLALLMNLREKGPMLEHLRQVYPDRDPTQVAAELLSRLSTGKADTARMLAQMADRINQDGLDLSRRLDSAIPDGIGDTAERARLFRAVVEASDGESAVHSLRRSFPETDVDALRGFADTVRAMSHLAVLFETSQS